MVDERKKIAKKKKNVNAKNNVKKQPNVQKVKKVSKQADDKSARIQKNRKIKKLLSWTILLAMLIGITVFLCTSKMFQICNIEIKGNNQVSQETLVLLSEIQIGQNIFLTNTSKAEGNIAQNSYIKDVYIKRQLPDKIQIEIIEKQKLYTIEFNGMYAYIDKEGYILETSQRNLSNLILLQGNATLNENIIAGNMLCKEDLKKLEDLENILKNAEKNNMSNKINKIDIKDAYNYILTMKEDRKIIYIGDTANLTTKMLRAKDILDKTIDLEGKIFVNGNFNDGFDPYFREEANN